MHVKGLWILIYIETRLYVFVCVCVCVCVCVPARMAMCTAILFTGVCLIFITSETINEITLNLV
jgi:hypothetical protein